MAKRTRKRREFNMNDFIGYSHTAVLILCSLVFIAIVIGIIFDQIYIKLFG